MSPDAEDDGRPEIIRAVHGVTQNGSWFLLADVAGHRPGDAVDGATSERLSRDEWLVVLGSRERDIIKLLHPSA